MSDAPDIKDLIRMLDIRAKYVIELESKISRLERVVEAARVAFKKIDTRTEDDPDNWRDDIREIAEEALRALKDRDGNNM